MEIVIKRIVEAIKSIYNEKIDCTYNEALKSLENQSIVGCDKLVVEKLMQYLLSYHMWRLCQKTFIYEFHKYRRSLSLPIDASSSKAFEAYTNLINPELLKKWFLNYKCLKKMVECTIYNICSYIEEACNNFENDVEVLCERKLVMPGSKLASIVPLDSDPHNGSKMALCFEFEPYKKVIYKPKSLEIDEVIDKIFTDILKFDFMPQRSPVASTYSNNKYGWQEFITHISVNQEQVAEAYYNLGVCAALFAGIGTTDLHDENVIFQGTMPYFIDLETGFKPKQLPTKETLLNSINDVVFKSVASTSILPAKLPTMPHQILIGAINTPYPQETIEKIFTIKNPGTDAVDLAKTNVAIRRVSVPLTLSDGSIPDPVPYQNSFVKGYERGYKEISNKKEEIINFLQECDFYARVIIRPTSQYALLFDAMLYPENLTDDAKLNKILEYLKASKIFEDVEVAENVLEQEKKSLKRGDIPYFCVKGNDVFINTSDYVLQEAFTISPIENAILILKKYSEKDLLQEKRLIAEGYAEIRIQEAKYLGRDEISYPAPIFSDILSRVTEENPYPLVDLLARLAIEKGDEIGWLGGMYGENQISYNSSIFSSFHDTGGIVLLFEHLAKYKYLRNDSRYSLIYNKAKKGLESMHSDLETLDDNISIISGNCSYEYLLKHGEQRLNKVEEKIKTPENTNLYAGDIFSGMAGLGLVVATFPETPKESLEKISTILQGKREDSLKQGIAHGKLGNLWAEFRVAFALRNFTRAKEIFEIVSNFSMMSPGWCNGNAGLLMVLTEMGNVLGISENFYHIADKATRLSKKSVDFSVCHGVSGVLQSLLFAYVMTKDIWYLSLAENYWKKVFRLAKIHGFYTGEKNRDYLLGYFLGWSGTADSAILLQLFLRGETPWIPLGLSAELYQKNCWERSKNEMSGCN